MIVRLRRRSGNRSRRSAVKTPDFHLTRFLAPQEPVLSGFPSVPPMW
jgi:hypothetical protein